MEGAGAGGAQLAVTVMTARHLAPGAGAAAADSMEQASPEPSLPAPQTGRPEPPSPASRGPCAGP